jgi:uncharacterized damage-inducible protein DinB
MKPSDLFAHWERVQRQTLAAIDLFSDSELAFRPFPASWPVGEIMLHIAGAEDGWFRHVVWREVSEWPPDGRLDEHPSRAAIKAVVSSVHSRTAAYLASLDESDLQRTIEFPWGGSASLYWVIWHVIEHEIHHRGELSLILGLLGRQGTGI